MTQATKYAIEDLPNLRLPELQAYYAEVIGEPTRCPNKKFLVRRITETLAEQAANSEAPPPPDPAPATEAAESDETELEQAADDDDAASRGTSLPPDKSLTKMSISDLQQCYVDVVGRPTSSSHRRYLIWKIRQAQKGKVPVGPRNRRAPGEPAPEFKVLPLRMEASLVERLDAARERLGLKNRMDLFRAALHLYLTNNGELDVAGHFVR